VLCVFVGSYSGGCLLRGRVARLGRMEECFGFIEPAKLEMSDTLLSILSNRLVYSLDHVCLADTSVRQYESQYTQHTISVANFETFIQPSTPSLLRHKHNHL